jgi:tetratricopeptide (TPR) repeat protein
MNRSLARIGVVGFLVLMMACRSWGQAQQAPAPPPPTSQPSSGAGSNRGNTGQQTDPTRQNRDAQMPLYVEGQIINENGQAPSDRISVKLSCGMRTLQTIKTDIRGYFRFALGLGNQSNFDLSAADEAPSSSIATGMNTPGGYSGFGTASMGLTGCDVHISVPGYVPMDAPITDIASLGVIDVGVLELRRIGTAPTGSVSATSLLVPNNARKEFEQGLKEMRNNRLPQATQHLERAVGAYDKYAAAWTELGRVYSASHEMQKARQSFEKAIAADPKYAPPYVSLGALQLDDENYEGALESIGKAVQVDPAIAMGVGGYIQGFANFRLNRLDAAQENLLQAEKGSHASTPQLHVILAELYLRKQDSSSAATHLRAYVKEAPQGSFADDVRKKLEEIDQAASNNAGGPGAQPAIAP